MSHGSKAAPGRHLAHRSRLQAAARDPLRPGFAAFDPEVGRSPGWAAEPETVRMGAVFSKASSVTHEPFQPFLPRRKRRIL